MLGGGGGGRLLEGPTATEEGGAGVGVGTGGWVEQGQESRLLKIAELA